MKRLLHFQFLLVLLLALGYSPLQAKRITQWQAQQQAYSFWGKQMPQKAKAKSRAATTASRSDAYYVFNNDAGGFVIIAGDDAVTPVLGYTSTGSFDAENLPDGLKDLLKSYERQIAALGSSYQANQTATRAAFTGEKLLNTAKWNQYAPFNKYTPNNYVTGCVATAGAIVMKHHGYPAKGTGSHSYTWNGKTWTANFEEHTYDWASMPAEYDGTNDAAFDGVARLMADLGVAVEMKYNKSGSGAYIGDLVTALQKYYGYSKLSHLMAIEDVGAEAWNGRLREEIDANRPVLYAASDPNTGGGHAFVIDGYKDESFSVNWGWGGYCDGFYKIGALNPESEGMPTGDKYNVGQSAVFGMEPSGGTEKVSPMGFVKDKDQMQVQNMNITDVKKGQRGTLFSMPIGNTGDRVFTGECVVALMNAKGERREIVSSQPMKLDKFAVNRYYISPTFSLQFTLDAEPGDYLAILAKEEGSSEYIELYDRNFERKRLPATGYEPLTFELNTKMGKGVTFKQASGGYNLPSDFYKNKPVLGSCYYYYLTKDEGISKFFAIMNGKLVDNVSTERINYFVGVKPVYDLEVRTYREYQEQELVVNLPGAGQLKEKLDNEDPDYVVYRNIKVNGNIDKRDFDELASYYFKSIDLSGAKVVAYEGSRADMVPKYAFEGNAYLEYFKMPAGVKELGSNAFSATKLKEIDLPETIEEFGLNTFNYCLKLTDVYMRHKAAPGWISWCVFASKSTSLYRTLHLYEGCKARYNAYPYTKNWIKYFDNVVEDLETTGIHSVTLDKKPTNAAIYDLNGRRITEAMKKGVYIKNGKKISAR